MSLMDAIFGAGKFMVGMGVGAILLFAGLMLFGLGFEQGSWLSMILGGLVFLVGGGLVFWGKRSRREAVAPSGG